MIIWNEYKRSLTRGPAKNEYIFYNLLYKSHSRFCANSRNCCEKDGEKCRKIDFLCQVRLIRSVKLYNQDGF